VPLAEALRLQARGDAVLIDVRSAGVYAAGHIPGARNVAAGEIETRSAEIRRMGRLAILYCG
jgi:rhodanese-related sulfurtransferase